MRDFTPCKVRISLLHATIFHGVPPDEHLEQCLLSIFPMFRKSLREGDQLSLKISLLDILIFN